MTYPNCNTNPTVTLTITTLSAQSWFHLWCPSHLFQSDFLLARASTTSGIADAFALSLTSVQPTSLAHHSYIQSSITATHCTMVFQKPQLTHLQHIQNSLAHAVVAAPRFSDPDQILQSLHWLKVQERIEYKVISTTYKVLQSSSPHYLRDIITIQAPAFPIHSIVVTGHSPSPTSSVKSQNH